MIKIVDKLPTLQKKCYSGLGVRSEFILRWMVGHWSCSESNFFCWTAFWYWDQLQKVEIVDVGNVSDLQVTWLSLFQEARKLFKSFIEDTKLPQYTRAHPEVIAVEGALKITSALRFGSKWRTDVSCSYYSTRQSALWKIKFSIKPFWNNNECNAITLGLVVCLNHLKRTYDLAPRKAKILLIVALND